MVKKLKTLVVIALLSFTSFSQKDTSKVCLPYPTAQKIAIELIQKDSLDAELKLTQNVLKEIQNKVEFQDSVIVLFEKKENEYKSEIKILEEKEQVYVSQVDKLKNDNLVLERKNKTLKTVSKWLGGGLVGTLAVIVTFISLK